MRKEKYTRRSGGRQSTESYKYKESLQGQGHHILYILKHTRTNNLPYLLSNMTDQLDYGCYVKPYGII